MSYVVSVLFLAGCGRRSRCGKWFTVEIMVSLCLKEAEMPAEATSETEQVLEKGWESSATARHARTSKCQHNKPGTYRNCLLLGK